MIMVKTQLIGFYWSIVHFRCLRSFLVMLGSLITSFFSAMVLFFLFAIFVILWLRDAVCPPGTTFGKNMADRGGPFPHPPRSGEGEALQSAAVLRPDSCRLATVGALNVTKIDATRVALRKNIFSKRQQRFFFFFFFFTHSSLVFISILSILISFSLF